MAIQYFDNGIIKKDTRICDDAKIYLTTGQGCETIWFKTVTAARKALEHDGIKTGRDLFDCTKCGCHYSIKNNYFRKYPMHACSKVKEKYAEQFEGK